MVLTMLRARARTHTIKVTVDNDLIRPSGRSAYTVDTLIDDFVTIPINLYKLIYYIGTIQTRRNNSSNRQKFLDKSDLIEKVKSSDDFRIDISGIRQTLGSETLGKISEDFGVGIGVLVADYLYNINKTTLSRITRNRKRPDIKCLTNRNDQLIVESKGYTNSSRLFGALPNAQIQKLSEPADIRTVSLTLLNEENITENYFLIHLVSQTIMILNLLLECLRLSIISQFSVLLVKVS